MNTGLVAGTTNFVENNPLPVTAELLKRGQQRFTINCSPCHGQLADGNGITKKIGAMAVVANLHDKRIVEMADGELFHVITQRPQPHGGLRAECHGAGSLGHRRLSAGLATEPAGIRGRRAAGTAGQFEQVTTCL